MARRKKVSQVSEELVESQELAARELETSTSEEIRRLREENKKLEAKLAKVAPERVKPRDGAVTFKSPWPKHQEVLRRGTYRSLSLNNTILEGPILAKFDFQVCTFRPEDTFVDFDGKVVRKIDRMREIYAGYVRRRKRPHFIEVTEDQDLKIQSFRERIPPSQLIEFRGPLVDLPAIPPPPKEASDTMDTLERRRPMYSR